jgi:hypothetical protein
MTIWQQQITLSLAIISLLTIRIVQSFGQEEANAQTNTNTNFTQLVETDKYQECSFGTSCYYKVNVLYESDSSLLFDSYRGDMLWELVDIAKSEGYTVEAMTSYIAEKPGGFPGRFITVSLTR